jgi:hypothetical protein
MWELTRRTGMMQLLHQYRFLCLENYASFHFDYSDYEPQKYNCVAIDDDILNDWWNELALIKTYFHSYSRSNFALARWGVTLILKCELGLMIARQRTD